MVARIGSARLLHFSLQNASVTIYKLVAVQILSCLVFLGNENSRTTGDTRSENYKSTSISYEANWSHINTTILRCFMSAAPSCGNTDALLWLWPHPDLLLPACLPACSVLFLSFGRDSHLGSLGRGREKSLLLN